MNTRKDNPNPQPAYRRVLTKPLRKRLRERRHLKASAYRLADHLRLRLEFSSMPEKDRARHNELVDEHGLLREKL